MTRPFSTEPFQWDRFQQDRFNGAVSTGPFQRDRFQRDSAGPFSTEPYTMGPFSTEPFQQDHFKEDSAGPFLDGTVFKRTVSKGTVFEILFLRWVELRSNQKKDSNRISN